MTIDAHQHFWKFNALRDSWITDDMAVIRRDFLPNDLLPELEEAGIQGCVAVQASESEEENDFLLSLAAENNFIKGVVGWVDLCADDVEKRLQFYAQNQKVKGFRHILQKETDRAFMLQPAFTKGIAKLKDFDFTYDILIHHDQLPFIPQFVQQFPEQKFVIDHLAKPDIKKRRNKKLAKTNERNFTTPKCLVQGIRNDNGSQLGNVAARAAYTLFRCGLGSIRSEQVDVWFRLASIEYSRKLQPMGKHFKSIHCSIFRK